MVTNWSGNIAFEPTQVVMPTSVEEVVRAVQDATRQGRRVRAVGSMWSFTDVVHTRDVLMSMAGLRTIHAAAQRDHVWGQADGVLALLLPGVRDTGRRFVHLQAGVTVNQLYRMLDAPPPVRANEPARGRWTLLTQGASSGQTVVGAIATGTHGGEHGMGPMSAMVRAIHLVGPGGRHHWIEPREGRITQSAAPLRASPGLRVGEIDVHYNDELFNAAVVGVGSIGVIVSVVVEVREQYGLSQRKVRMRWSAVKAAFRDGRLFSHEAFPSDAHPRNLADGRAVRGVPHSLEIFLNPYRIDDNYAGVPGLADRNCLVVERRRAIAINNTPNAFDGPFRAPGAEADSLGTIVDLEAHGPDRYRRRVDEIMNAGRAETAGYPVSYSVLDTYDGSGPKVPGLGLEIAVPVRDGAWMSTVEFMLSNFDLLVSRNKLFAGFVSLRFTRTSRALLAMQNFDHGAHEYVCHIELVGLKEVNVADVTALQVLGLILTGGVSTVLSAATGVGTEPNYDNSGNFEGHGDAFVADFEKTGMIGGRLHWGQLNLLDRAEVEDAYRLSLPAWKKASTALCSHGKWNTFSNDFTERCGLQSNHETVAAASWGPGRLDLFAFDETSNLRHSYWDGSWHWADTIANGFENRQRFLGPITAVSWGHGRVDVFGVGRNDELLQVWWNSSTGQWHWSNLGRPFPANDHFMGAITACSWGRGRIDIFGLGLSGDVLHVYYDGDWRSENLGNHFSSGERFSGTLTAAAWGPERIDVFGLGRGKRLLQLWRGQRRWNWSAPAIGFTGGQRFVAAPAVTSWGPGRLDLLGVGPNNNVLHAWFNGRWNGRDGGNAFSRQPIRRLRWGLNEDVPYRVTEQTGPTMFCGPIAAASMEEGRLDYFGLDGERRLLQVWYEGQWAFTDHGVRWV